MGLSLLAAAEESPDVPALVAGGEVHCFGELAGRVAASMAWLEEQGLTGCGRFDASSGPPVAVIGENRLFTLAAIYALIELGVPFALVHPRLTLDERRDLLAELGPRLVIEEDWTAPASCAPPPATPVADDERCLAVLFTSGTSGRPKGAILSRRAMVAAAAASEKNLGWERDDRWLLSLPVAHVGGLSIVTRCLLGRRALVTEEVESFDARRYCQVIERDRVTLVSLVPTMLRRLLQLEPSWQPPSWLRAILLGGAFAPNPLLEAAADRGWPVLTTYGLTEACSQVSTQRYGTVNRGEAGVGKPIDGLEVRLRGGDGRLDQEGIIEIRGPNLFGGYQGDEERAFDPEGWFSTGDYGCFDDDGCLHLLGRRQDLILSGGENVYPLEVEQVIESHSAIVAACVFGIEDADWGQTVCAAFVRDPDKPVSDEDLAALFRRRLAPFKRPRRIAEIAELPLTAGNKPDREAVRKSVEGRLRELGGRRS